MVAGLVPAPVSEMCHWLMSNDMKGKKAPGWSLGVEGLFRKPGPGKVTIAHSIYHENL